MGAYRKQALVWHPDKARGDPKAKAAATERFQKITEAFDTLFDPHSRAKYDAGEVKSERKTLKLQGHGWSKVADDDDAALTPMGYKYKKNSWMAYVLAYGRADDDVEDLVFDDKDPRCPAT